MSFKERTDVTAVPAMGVVAETMVALVLADEAQRKFGGDSVGEFVRNAEAFRDLLTRCAPRRCDDRHLVLVGLMGSARPRWARIVAERLGRPFVDSDLLIEARTGRTVKQIFGDDGEAAYRVASRRRRCSMPSRTPEPAVIAAAGGVVLEPGEPRRAARRRRDVVWLQRRPELLVDRVTSGEHRPLLDDDPAGTLQRMYDDREQLYREVADACRVDGRRSVVDAARATSRRTRSLRMNESSCDATSVASPSSGERSYDVLVGHGAAVQLGCAAAVDGPAGGRGQPARAAGLDRGQHPARRVRDRTRRAAQVAGHDRRPLPRVRRHGPHAQRRRHRASAAAWSPMSPGSPPPRTTAACRWSTSRRRCWRWSTPRSVARPASTFPRARTWSGRSGSRHGVVCDLDALDDVARARAALRLRRDGEVPLPHRRRPAGDADDRPRRPLCGDQGRGRRVRRARGRAAGDAQLRAHAGPRARDRDRITIWPTARRSRSVWSSPPTSPIGSSASTTRASSEHYRGRRRDLRAADGAAARSRSGRTARR